MNYLSGAFNAIGQGFSYAYTGAGNAYNSLMGRSVTYEQTAEKSNLQQGNVNLNLNSGEVQQLRQKLAGTMEDLVKYNAMKQMVLKQNLEKRLGDKQEIANGATKLAVIDKHINAKIAEIDQLSDRINTLILESDWIELSPQDPLDLMAAGITSEENAELEQELEELTGQKFEKEVNLTAEEELQQLAGESEKESDINDLTDSQIEAEFNKIGNDLFGKKRAKELSDPQ